MNDQPDTIIIITGPGGTKVYRNGVELSGIDAASAVQQVADHLSGSDMG
jgi:hypothetical protein